MLEMEWLPLEVAVVKEIHHDLGKERRLEMTEVMPVLAPKACHIAHHCRVYHC